MFLLNFPPYRLKIPTFHEATPGLFSEPLVFKPFNGLCQDTKVNKGHVPH